MNVIAFLCGIIGAGLTFFQEVHASGFLPGMNLIGLLQLTSGNNVMGKPPGEIVFFLMVIAFAALVAVVSGFFALKSNGGFIGFIVSAAICFIIFILVNMVVHEQLPFMRGTVMNEFLLWGVIYASGALFAYIDSRKKHVQPQQDELDNFYHTNNEHKQHSYNHNFNGYEPVLGVETEALIKRAYLFIEESDFYQAKRYLEQALNQNPENPTAYFGRLLAELELKNSDELPDVENFSENKYFKLALRFADEDLKNQLERYVEIQNDKKRLAAEKLRLEQEAEKERKKQERATFERILFPSVVITFFAGALIYYFMFYVF